MAKRRQGTIQQILDRHYATIRERANKPDGRSSLQARERARKRCKATMRAYWAEHKHKRDPEETPELIAKLKEKHNAQMRDPAWRAANRRGPIFSPYSNKIDAVARKRQKANIARWQKETPVDESPRF